jgi:hypothetical protein
MLIPSVPRFPSFHVSMFPGSRFPRILRLPGLQRGPCLLHCVAPAVRSAWGWALVAVLARPLRHSFLGPSGILYGRRCPMVRHRSTTGPLVPAMVSLAHRNPTPAHASLPRRDRYPAARRSLPTGRLHVPSKSYKLVFYSYRPYTPGPIGWGMSSGGPRLCSASLSAMPPKKERLPCQPSSTCSVYGCDGVVGCAQKYPGPNV